MCCVVDHAASLGAANASSLAQHPLFHHPGVLPGSPFLSPLHAGIFPAWPQPHPLHAILQQSLTNADDAAAAAVDSTDKSQVCRFPLSLCN